MKNPAIITGFFVSIMDQLRYNSGLLKLLLVIIFLNGPGAFAQVGVHTDFPDVSSAMDIYATDKGLLIPRVTLSNSLLNPSPVTAPVANGLLVFNSGSNQALGFYYWNSTLSSWVLLGGGSSPGGDFWSLTGNTGTIPGTNFLGTTDANHFIIKTNALERMRFESDGQVVIGNTSPYNASDRFTVVGNTTQNYAINAFSPYVSFFADADYTGFFSSGGRYGLVAQVDTAGLGGFGVYAKNFDPLGYGLVSIGSNIPTASVGIIASHTAGITSYGYDGLHAWAKNADGYGIFTMGSNTTSYNISGRSAGISSSGNDGVIAIGRSATGRGIIAIGSGGSSPSISNESEGGAFTGYHGVYARGVNANGIGVIGVGSNAGTYSIISGGLGGTFTGNYGVYGKGLATDGVGVLGLGSNGSGYYTLTNGSGGAFTGFHGMLAVGSDVAAGMGVVGAGNNGSYVILPAGAGGVFTGITIGSGGFGTSQTAGIGVIGAGNNQAVWVPSNGCGGAFIGNTGVFSRSSNATGTGVVGLGNNQTTPGTFSNGAGGAFTGTSAGSVSWALAGTGTAVIGAGNNITTPLTYTDGSGGAFTGTGAGVVGYGTTATSGVGVIGLGNNITTPGTFTNGAGGKFSGLSAGAIGWGTTAATGTGIIGAGNNIATPLTYTGGSGGAFTGTTAGMVAYGITAASGVGVIGLGNNITTAVLPGANGCGGAFTGTFLGVVGYATLANDVSIGVLGQYNGSGSNSDGIGVKGIALANNNRGYGVYGQGNRYGLYSNGNTGASGTKQFVIDHPLDPENKILRHYSVESPEILNMYRGNIVLNSEGEATIQLPEYFTAININYSYVLTPIGRQAPNLYIKEEIDGNGNFSIAGGSPDQKVSWVVYAERNDLFVQQEGERAVEIEKDDNQKGKYIMPELYNQPPEKGIFYTESIPQNIQTGELNYMEAGGKSTNPFAEQPAIINQINILETIQLEKVMSEKGNEKVDQTIKGAILQATEDSIIEVTDDPHE